MNNGLVLTRKFDYQIITNCHGKCEHKVQRNYHKIEGLAFVLLEIVGPWSIIHFGTDIMLRYTKRWHRKMVPTFDAHKLANMFRMIVHAMLPISLVLLNWIFCPARLDKDKGYQDPLDI